MTAPGKSVIQCVRLQVGKKEYDAGVHNQEGEYYFVLPQSTGKKLFIHIAKSTIKISADLYKVNDYEVPYVEQYLAGKLVLHRGADSDHPVYNQIKQGTLVAKPTATLEYPEFTSESSTTKFIPFSTDRNIAVMAGKAKANADGVDRTAIADTELGSVVSVVVGTQHSVAIFDAGEIQVLAPPKGHAAPIFGKTSGPAFSRVDGQAWTEQSALEHVRARLASQHWNTLGVGFFGAKTPAGIESMRQATTLRQIVTIARTRDAKADKDRHPDVAAFYKEVIALGAKLHIV